MDANVAEIGKGWRMRMLMNGRMGSLPHGPHWKIPPDGLAAAWLIPNFSLLISNYHDTSRQLARFSLAFSGTTYINRASLSIAFKLACVSAFASHDFSRSISLFVNKRPMDITGFG